MQSKTRFPSSHQLKSYVAPKSRLKLAERCPVSGYWPSCITCFEVFKLCTYCYYLLLVVAVLRLLYSAGQPALAGTPIKNWRILLKQIFTARMPLLSPDGN